MKGCLAQRIHDIFTENLIARSVRGRKFRTYLGFQVIAEAVLGRIWRSDHHLHPPSPSTPRPTPPDWGPGGRRRPGRTRWRWSSPSPSPDWTQPRPSVCRTSSLAFLLHSCSSRWPWLKFSGNDPLWWRHSFFSPSHYYKQFFPPRLLLEFW